MHDPLISIVIPTYNRPNILFNTIINVLNQTWENIQIIIIDDGSDSKTEQVIKSIDDKRIEYKRNAKNIGCALSRLIGVQLSRGEYITFLDDDDTWDKNYLQNQYKIFNKDIFLDIVMCNYNINHNNNYTTKHSMKPFVENFIYMIHKNPGPFFQCCMFNNKILKNAEELFDNLSSPSEDWNFFINISRRKPLLGHSNRNDFTWNYSHQSQSSNLSKEVKSLVYIVGKHKKQILQICGKIILSDHYRRIARLYEYTKNHSRTIQYYKKAFYIAPLWWKNIFYIILLGLGKNKGLAIINIFRGYKN